MADANTREPLVNRADIGREVMPEVKLLDVAVEPIEPRKVGRFVTPAGERVVLDYDVKGWLVRLRTGNYWTSAEIVGLEVGNGDTRTGVTTDLLRGIPLADARRRIREIQRRWAETVAPAWEEVDRLRTPYDWATFARAYVNLVEQGERSPVTFIAGQLGISRNTVGARVRLARDKGLITRPTPESLGQLTPKARRILRAQEG